MTYQERVRALLTSPEKKLFSRLSTPRKVQDYLDTLPVNFELKGETYMSPRTMLDSGVAHCFEGATFAAAVFAYHGREPLLMDLQTTGDDEDHVVALFQENGFWGAVSKTNHGILRYRDAVYATPRELAMSYFHEYYLENGAKTLRHYSKPYDLSQFNPTRWVTSPESLEWLVDKLDWCRHFPVAPKKNLTQLRAVSKLERRNLKHTEWAKNGARKA
ncbi:hypothetical protein K8R03_03975 [Candidatus Kaiserbacteria bacterium]|nr:hypothetical protein [Candidatus Kaiserbacteria bacterium]